MKPVLKVEHLYKSFDSKEVLKDISFELYPGDVLGVIGPNGAGKSTLLYILLDIISPSAGKIFYFGKEFSKNRTEVLKRVSFASQYVSLPYSLSVEENLKVFACFYEIKEIDKKIDELLEIFKLKDKKKVLTRALSSGEMMRLNLARAFLNEPYVLLLDEPTAGLDPEYIRYISNLLKDMSLKKRLTIILTSHQLGELERIANKLLLINLGKTLGYGSLSKLLKEFEVESLEELYFKIFV